MNCSRTPHAARRGALLALTLLAACGGGGSEAPPAPGPAPAPVPAPAPPSVCSRAGTPYELYAKAGTTWDQPGAVTIAGCTGPIDSPVWTQTAGPLVEQMNAAKSQTLSFQPTNTGSHRFRVDFRDAQGTPRSEEVSLDVGTPASATRLALRVSHSVRMGGNVSVRAWPLLQAGDAVQSIAWSQVEGPAVTLDTRDSHVALFVAPPVAHDTLIRLRATLTTSAGRTASDEALVLVEQHAQAAAGDGTALWAGDHVSRVHAYRATSPYAAVLARCVYDSSLRTNNLCPLSQLPFLAQDAGGFVPSVEQVMDRVLVSHDWAGRNFETLLRTFDDGTLRRMLMSVTAIVVGTHVRPSFYYAGTGAIYLDAENFWVLPDERDTVNEAPDFRSGFGDALQYTSLWRYVVGSSSLFQYHDPRQRVFRGASAIKAEAGWLMFHELAHALDFMPPSRHGALNPALSAWANIEPRVSAQQLASDTVPAAWPLRSAEMGGLGQVRFLGATANAVQAGYTPAQVAGFFSADLATDDYAYATPREDVAMALEEFLMSREGVRRDFAITPRWGPGATGSTIAVQWGQRGRIGEPALRPRLRAIVQQLTPWIDVAEVDRIAAPIAMRSGDSWTGNLVLPGPPPPSPQVGKTEPTLQDLWLLEQAERRRHRLQRSRPPLPRH
ncbi:MAG: hypothetical protein KIT17_23155 [Rubrivivax sp.]|nr:hypothetical protein [Rubrivivax sp.]